MSVVVVPGNCSYFQKNLGRGSDISKQKLAGPCPEHEPGETAFGKGTQLPGVAGSCVTFITGRVLVMFAGLTAGSRGRY